MTDQNDPREEDAHKVHEAASEIALVLGTDLMKLLPELTAKYGINPQSFIVAAAQAALKTAASGVASVTHMSRDELLALQGDLNATVRDAIRRNLPDLQGEHDHVWKVASDEGKNADLLMQLSKTFDRIEETLADLENRSDLLITSKQLAELRQVLADVERKLNNPSDR